MSKVKSDKKNNSKEDNKLTSDEKAITLSDQNKIEETTSKKANEGTAHATISKSKQRAKEKERGKKFHVNMLNISHLQKYRKYNKLPTVKVRSSREELVKAAGEHFNSIQVNEPKFIAEFLFHIAKKKSKIYSAIMD